MKYFIVEVSRQYITKCRESPISSQFQWRRFRSFPLESEEHSTKWPFANVHYQLMITACFSARCRCLIRGFRVTRACHQQWAKYSGPRISVRPDIKAGHLIMMSGIRKGDKIQLHSDKGQCLLNVVFLLSKSNEGIYTLFTLCSLSKWDSCNL